MGYGDSMWADAGLPWAVSILLYTSPMYGALTQLNSRRPSVPLYPPNDNDIFSLGIPSWDGTEHMETFLIPTLVEWKEKRAARALAELDPNASASQGEDESEQEDDTKSGDGDDKQPGGVRSDDDDDEDANRGGGDGDAGAVGGGATKADGVANTK